MDVNKVGWRTCSKPSKGFIACEQAPFPVVNIVPEGPPKFLATEKYSESAPRLSAAAVLKMQSELAAVKQLRLRAKAVPSHS